VPLIDRSGPTRSGPARAALSGLLAAACGLGLGELVAGAIGAGSPVRRVGDRVIDGAPRWLKTFAIDQFGTNDKPVLVGSILVVLAVASLFVGRLAGRRFVEAAVAVAAVTAAGLAFALTGRKPEGIDAWPIVVAGGVTIMALRLFRPSVVAARGPVDSLGGSGPVTVVGRRQFVTMGGATAGVAALSTVIGRRLQGDPKATAVRETIVVPKARETLGRINPKTTADVVGMTPWQTPTSEFYRIDTALVVPRLNAETWKMTIGGRVKNPITLTYADLQKRPLVEHDCTLMCVSNEVGGGLIGNARWTGVRLADVLREAGVQEGADQLFVTSTDGFTAGFPTKLALDGREALIAIAMNGEPLPFKHGFPARLVIPGIYGYVSAVKWLDSIELTTFDEKQGYWIPRGWSVDGPIKTGSRIDVIGLNNKPTVGVNAIAGVAWDQHTGIAKVEVQVDDEPWGLAELAADGGIDTWRQWKLVWTATAGRHTVRVRATNAKGATQVEERAPVAPDGATGWHTVEITVR
jgi:DMSO/TMAO reductase YedYZ molybdopterin-dependent catalytic subunit